MDPHKQRARTEGSECDEPESSPQVASRPSSPEAQRIEKDMSTPHDDGNNPRWLTALQVALDLSSKESLKDCAIEAANVVDERNHLRAELRNAEDLALRMSNFGAFENSGCANERDLYMLKKIRDKRPKRKQGQA